MATATLDKIRKEEQEARTKANTLLEKLREAEDAALAEQQAKEAKERERRLSEEEKKRQERLKELQTKADKLDLMLRDAWPLICELRQELNIPHRYHQKAREAYKALARFYK